MSKQLLEQIRQRVALLTKKRVSLENQISELTKQNTKLSQTIHRNELILLTTPPDTSGMFHLANEIRKDSHTLHGNKNELNGLTRKLADASKQVASAEFWMKQATYGDETKQQEALRRIFD